MRWVAPTERDEANHALEKRLWSAADQFRANSGLKAGEYSGPVESTRHEYEQRIARQNDDTARREAAIAKAKESLEEQVAHKVRVERGRIVAEEAKKAKLAAATDLEQKTKEVADLQDVLKQRDPKLAENTCLKDRFLFEMATGTGKTLTAAAVIKLFLRSGNASRVLFLVDRLELEEQARKALVALLRARLWRGEPQPDEEVLSALAF